MRFLFWSRVPDGYRKNDRKRAVVWPWLVLELSTVLALTQLGIRQSDWWRAGIRSTSLHIVVEFVINLWYCIRVPQNGQWINTNNSIPDVSIVHIVNLLLPSDAIWRQRSGSTLARVMACCLTVPSHYLNQCWPIIISEVQWHSY